MDIERGLVQLQEAAERLAWQMDHSGVTGAGADESGTVRVLLDDVGHVQQVDIGHLWWRDVGPDRLSEAILDAANHAAVDRMKAWADRVAERGGGQPPADWRSPKSRHRDNDGSNDLRSVQTAAGESRAEGLLCVSELAEAAMSELEAYRRRMEDRAQSQVIGRGRNDRVTVAMTGGQITYIEINQQWLREQPSGWAVGSELHAACLEAYERGARDEVATMTGLPALAEMRDLAADPAALLRRSGLTR
ncbi:hypothetical protein ABGB07_26745 [Micromonosporaceae bacterium B7E4]